MPTLLDLLNGRRDQSEDEIRKQADESQARYEAGIGERVPEERGITEESDILPNRDAEMAAGGWSMGAAPAPPGGGGKSPPKGIIAKLRDLGLREDRIAEIGNELRQGNPYVFRDAKGKVIGQIAPGETNPAVKELAEFSRDAVRKEMGGSRGFDYSNLPENAGVGAAEKAPKQPKIAGEALDFYEETGVDPTRKSALNTLDEMRKKGVYRGGK